MQRHITPIVSGHGRGKLLGYPTFNLVIPDDFELGHGIYACWVWIDDVKHMGAMHYGPVPVFDQPEPSLEIFVIDWEDDGQPIEELTFAVGPYLRKIMSFDSPELLAEQIGVDVKSVRDLLD